MSHSGGRAQSFKCKNEELHFKNEVDNKIILIV